MDRRGSKQRTTAAMPTPTRRTRLLSQAPSSERSERKSKRKRRSIKAGEKTSTKAAGRRIREDENEREAKKKREDEEMVSSAPSSPLHEPYLSDDNWNRPPELMEAFKLAKRRYTKKKKVILIDRYADMITLEFCNPSCMFFNPQLLPVFEPATKAVLLAAKFVRYVTSEISSRSLFPIRVDRVICIHSEDESACKPLKRCSGFWIDWDEENKTGIVLTTAHLILSKEPLWLQGAEYAAKAKVTIHLSDDSTTDGHRIYYQEHYDLAFFRATVNRPVQLPSFKNGVECAQLVFRLGRDESFNLSMTHCRPGYMNPLPYERPHYMYFQGEDDDIKYDDGGPIIDLDAKVVGMVNNCRSGSFIPSSILLKCVDLWKKFKFIPRPHLGLVFSGIKLLDPVQVEKLWRKYKIDDGLIVVEVSKGSQAEEIGIRKGDIIECFNGECISTTIQLENLLLSLCKSAGNGHDSKVHVSVGVFHTRKLRRWTKEFTAGVSDCGEVIEIGYHVTLGEGTSAASVST